MIQAAAAKLCFILWPRPHLLFWKFVHLTPRVFLRLTMQHFFGRASGSPWRFTLSDFKGSFTALRIHGQANLGVILPLLVQIALSL